MRRKTVGRTSVRGLDTSKDGGLYMKVKVKGVKCTYTVWVDGVGEIRGTANDFLLF